MPKTIISQYYIDDEGKNHVISTITKMKGIVQDIDIKKDFGFDFNIHLTEERNILKKKKRIFIPLILRAQLKSGDSYFINETEDTFSINIDEDDIDIWKRSNTPVILIVYKSSDKKAYWINIRKYIGDCNYKGYGSLKVTIKKLNLLTKKSYLDFLDILYKEQKGTPFHQLQIYKPIYDFLLEKYNIEDNNQLKLYQDNYENSSTGLYSNNIYDNDKIQMAIDFALSQRRLHSIRISIYNLEDLNRRITHSSSNVHQSNYTLVKYYLCVLYLEDNRFHEAKECLTKLLGESNNFKKRYLYKYHILNALINDGLNELKESLKSYDIILNSSKIKNLNLKGILCICAGVLCRRLDVYAKSKKYFTNSIKHLKHSDLLSGIAFSNLGALYYIWGKLDLAKTKYNYALTLFNQSGIHSGSSSVYRNLSSIKRDDYTLNRGSASDSYDLLRSSIQSKAKDEYESIDENKLDGHSYLTDELFQLYSKNSITLSDNYYDGITSFTKAENLCDHLGNYAGKRSCLYDKGKYLFLIGNVRKDFNITLHSLGHFILINYEEGIKIIAQLGINNKSKKEFRRFLKWVNSIRGDRLAEIGRLVFYKEFANYIPDSSLEFVFKLLIKYESKGYNFTNTFDFGRYSNKALEEIINRLSKEQTLQIMNKILNNLESDNLIINDSNINLLGQLNFKHLNSNQLFAIIRETEKLLFKDRYKANIYNIWINLAVNVNNDLITRAVFCKVLNSENNDIKKLNYLELRILANPVFDKLRTEDINNIIVNKFCEYNSNESRSETLHSYSGGGSSIPFIMANIYSALNTDLQNIILNNLINYIGHDNLVPYKRADAILAISHFSKNINKNKISKLSNTLKKIINQDFKEIQNRYYYDDHFLNSEPYDFYRLKLYSLKCFVQIGNKDLKYVFNNINSILNCDLKDSTCVSALNIMGDIGTLINDTNNLSLIMSYLLHFTNNSNDRIKMYAVYNISKLIKHTDVYQIDIVTYVLNKYRYKSNSSIRWCVANACVNLRKKKINNIIVSKIIKDLKNDINCEVRNEL